MEDNKDFRECKVCKGTWVKRTIGEPLLCPRCKSWHWNGNVTIDGCNMKKKSQRKPLTQDRLCSLFDYNPETGELSRKVSAGGRGYEGEVVGGLDSRGYIQVGIDNARRLVHRVIWMMHYGYWPEDEIDHIDGDKTNNKLENLREVRRSCNMINRPVRKDNKTSVTGVVFHKATGKWQATIAQEKRKIYLGIYSDFVEAAAHRLAAEQCLGWDVCSKRDSSTMSFMKAYLEGGDEDIECNRGEVEKCKEG